MEENILCEINPNIPGLIYCADIFGNILSCTYDFARLFNYNHYHDLIGCSLTSFFYTETVIKINNNVDHIKQVKSTQQFDETWRLLNNKILNCKCSRTPIFNTRGECLAVITTAFDITSHAQETQLLQETINKTQKEKKTTELYLHNIIVNLPDHVFWEDREGKFLGCNDLHAINAGLEKAEDLVGKTVEDLAKMLNWTPGILEDLRRNDLYVMDNDKTVCVEEEVVWSDGVPRTYLSKKAPLKDENGDCIGIIALAFDITERIQMEKKLRIAKEEAESANLAKSNFIANISHDLRTPLHTVLGIAELLQIKKHYPEQEDLIEGIIQSGQSLLQLVEQILEYSELEANKNNLQLENLDLRQLIESLIVEFAPKAKKKGLDLIISYCESTPRLVKSNPQYLRRILSNLLGNSIKFTNQGHILIAVEPVKIYKEQAILQIIVEDTGIGISAHDIKHIFERFYRSAPSHTGKYKGSGLGLAIAKQLAEYLGGRLNVNSQLGYGTTFSCTLTFVMANHNVDYHELENQFADANILIVDDHTRRRETLLKQLPCKNKLALTSNRAVELIAKKNLTKYNLILIDDDIKTQNPSIMVENIRSQNQDWSPMLVLITKLKNNQSINSTPEYFQQVLSKPMQPTDITHRLAPTWRKWLESKQRKQHKPIMSNLRVLLVEDEPLIQRFTKAILAEFGCQVEVATTGKEALNLAQKCFDLIFMDIGLPDMSGIDVTKRLRQSNQINQKTPIIALTAHVSEEDKNYCLSAGVNDFLTKPASYSNFYDLLSKYQTQTVQMDKLLLTSS